MQEAGFVFVPSAARWLTLSLSLALLPVWGCGQSENVPDIETGVVLKGRIVSMKTPLVPENAPPGTGAGEVILIPVSQSDGKASHRESGTVDEDGKFQIVGDGKGVAPGEYRLGVIPPGDAGVPGGDTLSENKNPLAEKFSVENSPIKVTVPQEKVGEEHDLGLIDLDKF